MLRKVFKRYKIVFFIFLGFFIISYFIYVNSDSSVEADLEIEQEGVENSIKLDDKNNKKIKVDIKGMINNPGVYEIDEGSRVIDVINMSGGLLDGADTSDINLSKILKDENVIVIGNVSEPEKSIEYVYKECDCPKFNDACINSNDVVNYQESNNSSVTNDSAELGLNSLISINKASINELQTLPGVGESKAKAIVKYREDNGLFDSLEDVMNVSGIGNALFEKIKDYITL